MRTVHARPTRRPRFKNPWHGTIMATLAKHMMLGKGWTHDQVQTWLETKWDQYGDDGRRRLIVRLTRRVVRRYVLANVTDTWVDSRGVWAHRLTGKGASSNVLVKSA